MSIHFISGKPGGGKSLFALRMVVRELVDTQRNVVTNLPIVWGELNAYLQAKYPDKSIDLFARLRLLKEDEVPSFFRCRGSKPGAGYPDLMLSDAPGGGTDYAPAFDHPACLYVIDELHMYFNSRAWRETGKEVLSYLSQHRKLGDDVICVTQSIGNVDKQFRSVAQDFTYLRNHRKEKLGIFRSFPFFTFSTYMQPATGQNDQAAETGTFRLDVSGMCKCYNTAAGVGIVGKAADSGERAKGLSVLWVVVAFIAVAVALFYGPDLAMAAVFGGSAKAPVKAKEAAAGNPAPLVFQTVPAKPGAAVGVPVVPVARAPVVENPVYLSGVVKLASGCRIYLTTGEVLTERSPGLELVSDELVIYRGQVIRWPARQTGAPVR